MYLFIYYWIPSKESVLGERKNFACFSQLYPQCLQMEMINSSRIAEPLRIQLVLFLIGKG